MVGWIGEAIDVSSVLEFFFANSATKNPIRAIAVAARNVSEIALAVSSAEASVTAAGKSGSVIGGSSSVARRSLNLAKPHAVSAARPTLRPTSRTIITIAAAAPR